MEKIPIINPRPEVFKSEPQKKIILTNQISKQKTIDSLRWKKITVIMDEYLLTKLKNIIKGEQASGQFKYGSVSAIIRASLQSYQDNPQITMTRQLGNPRLAYTFCCPGEFYELYLSWPLRQRTANLENILHTYLNII